MTRSSRRLLAGSLVFGLLLPLLAASFVRWDRGAAAGPLSAPPARDRAYRGEGEPPRAAPDAPGTRGAASRANPTIARREPARLARGRVRLPDGSPAASARVYGLDPAWLTDTPSLLDAPPAPREPDARTDDDGAFELAPAADLLVLAHAPGIGWARAEGMRDGLELRVEPEPAIELRLRARSGAAAVAARLALRRLPFRLGALPGAFVPSTDRWDRARALVERHELGTDAAGRATLAGAGEGVFLVAAEAPGFASWECPLGIPREGREDLTMNPEAVIRGVVRARGAPAPGASVRVLDPSDPLVPWTAPQGCDAEGRFALRTPVPRALETSLLVRAEAPGCAPAVAEVPGPAAGFETQLSIDLGAGLALAGRAVGAAGEPVAGAWVWLLDAHGGVPLDQAVTDAEGRFRWEAAPAGRALRVRAVAPRRAAAERAVASPADLAEPLVLQPGGSLVLRVFSEDGLPAGTRCAATVRRERGGDDRWETHELPLVPVDEDPRREATVEIPTEAPGVHEAVVEVPGFAPAILAGLRIPPGGRADERAVLRRGVLVRGAVVGGPRREPAPGVLVAILRRRDGGSLGRPFERLRATTGSDGSFEIGGVLPGSWEVGLEGPEDLHGFHRVEVPDALLADVGSLVLPAPGSIRGVVTFSGPAPAPLPVAVVLDEGGSTLGARAVAPDGSFLFERVVPARYVVTLRGGGDGRAEVGDAPVTVREAQESEVALRYGRARLRGVLARAGEPPKAPWTVQLERFDGSAIVAWRPVRPDGTFDFEGLEPGPLALLARGGGDDAGSVLVRPVALGDATEECQLSLSGESVAFRAVDRAGRPVAAATVYARREGSAMRHGIRLGSTDADGLWRGRDLERGPHRFVLAKAGHAMARLRDVVPSAEGDERRVVLAPESTIEARVEDTEGRPLAGATLRVKPNDPPETAARAHTTDAEGRTVARELASGRHELVASAAGHAAEALEVDLAEGERRAVTLRLRRAPRRRAPLTPRAAIPTIRGRGGRAGPRRPGRA